MPDRTPRYRLEVTYRGSSDATTERIRKMVGRQPDHAEVKNGSQELHFMIIRQTTARAAEEKLLRIRDIDGLTVDIVDTKADKWR